MSLAAARELAASGELYPSLILYGADDETRREAALGLARLLLCEKPGDERPCGACRHCRHIVWPGEGNGNTYHPDFAVLQRDLKTSTSVSATRAMLKTAQVAPFEARGQVFVVASADSLSGEAANALLKTLEEPSDTAPRHFMLLTPSRQDLLPTLRSRSLSLYLGPAEPFGDDEVLPVAESFGREICAWVESRAGVHLMTAAAALAEAGSFKDPRSGRPWAVAAAAVARVVTEDWVPAELRRSLLDLAEDLLAAPRLRLRGITEKRILEGLVAERLGPHAPRASAGARRW
jgi:DNA polymerase III subunit delta'